MMYKLSKTGHLEMGKAMPGLPWAESLAPLLRNNENGGVQKKPRLDKLVIVELGLTAMQYSGFRFIAILIGHSTKLPCLAGCPISALKRSVLARVCCIWYILYCLNSKVPYINKKQVG